MWEDFIGSCKSKVITPSLEITTTCRRVCLRAASAVSVPGFRRGPLSPTWVPGRISKCRNPCVRMDLWRHVFFWMNTISFTHVGWMRVTGTLILRGKALNVSMIRSLQSTLLNLYLQTWCKRMQYMQNTKHMEQALPSPTKATSAILPWSSADWVIRLQAPSERWEWEFGWKMSGQPKFYEFPIPLSERMNVW